MTGTQAFGWFASIFALLIYLLYSTRIVRGKDYHWLNLVSCWVMCVYSLMIENLPGVGLAMAWGFVAVLGLSKEKNL